jgi:uncharacterized protein
MGRTHDAFAKPKYLALTTFRKDGRAVSTPVWFAHDGDRLVVITGRESGKAKRIRNGSRVLVAPCDMRGRPNGEAVEAVAILQDREGTAATRHAVRKRYGIQARLLFRGSGPKVDEVGIAITLAEDASAG